MYVKGNFVESTNSWKSSLKLYYYALLLNDPMFDH